MRLFICRLCRKAVYFYEHVRGRTRNGVSPNELYLVLMKLTLFNVYLHMSPRLSAQTWALCTYVFMFPFETRVRWDWDGIRLSLSHPHPTPVILIFNPDRRAGALGVLYCILSLSSWLDETNAGSTCFPPPHSLPSRSR
jgi:hypothetical protein